MPGLVGFTTPRSPIDAPAVLRSLRSALVRYPFHVEDELFADGNVAATRLHNGAFPHVAEPVVRREIHAWLDGEIVAQGSVDTPNDGVARLAASFAEGAPGPALAAFNGAFAACVYDRARGRVHLIADRCGFRHLYYVVHDGALWWSSEIKALAAIPGRAPRMRPSAVDAFFRQGYMDGNETWLEGVELVPGGTVVTWDIAQASLALEAYWRYDDIVAVDRAIGIDAMAEELGERFLTAVRRRSETARVGLLLSGGLDSRAVLAAIPAGVSPLHAVTYGQRGSSDVRWARHAARVRGAIHHVEEIGQGEWLAPRFAGVWWTDGQVNLLEMHNITNHRARRQWFDVNVSGFVGDLVLGGSYVRPTGPSEREAMATRCRRFTSVGIRLSLPFYEMRLPFTDNDVIDYGFGLPDDLKRGAFIYSRMLLRFFPRYFRHIPWQATGVPISWPPRLSGFVRRVNRRTDFAVLDFERRTGVRIPWKRQFVDYAAWLRRESTRGLVESLLLDPKRRASAYDVAGDVPDLWRRHLAGENHAGMLGRHLTFEVWLRQLLDGELRPRDDI